MEINEDRPNVKREKLLIESLLRRSGRPPLVFDRDSKVGRRVRKLYSEQWGRFQLCLDWRLLHEETEGRPTKKEGFSVIALESVFLWLS